MSYSNFGVNDISCMAALKSHVIIFLIDRALEVNKWKWAWEESIDLRRLLKVVVGQDDNDILILIDSYIMQKLPLMTFKFIIL